MSKKHNFFTSLPVKITAFILCIVITAALVTGIVLLSSAFYFTAYDNSSNTELENMKTSFISSINNQDRQINKSIFRLMYNLFNFAITNTTVLIFITFALLITFIILFVYSIRIAGKRPNTELIIPKFFDRIPFDLFLFFIFLTACSVIPFIANLYRMDPFFIMVFIGIIYIVLYADFLWLLNSFSIRIKCGNLIKGALTYKIILFLLNIILKIIKFIYSISKNFLKFCLKLFRELPLIWRSVLGYCVFVIIYIISFSSISNYRNEFPVFIIFLLTIGGLLIVAAIAYELQILKKAGEKIASGDINYNLSTNHLFWEFKKYAETLSNIRLGMSAAVEQRIKSEQFKTELITNVSHDIKTPLTSIINYVDLLSREENISETAGEYINILKRQSARLKKLTDDVIEVSKAASGTIKAEIIPTDLCELVSQCAAEYSEKMEKASIKLVVNVPLTPVICNVDGRLMWRIFDNLMGNAYKYAQTNTRVYLTLLENENEIQIVMKNISREPLDISPDELMERFVRGDRSRGNENAGSGLGLSIARSLLELQNGELSVEIDGDLFKTYLIFQKSQEITFQ